jgi:hypothetical protein
MLRIDKLSHYTPGKTRLPEFLHSRQGCQLYVPAACTSRRDPLVLISVRRWVDPRTTVLPEKWCKWKTPTHRGSKPPLSGLLCTAWTNRTTASPPPPACPSTHRSTIQQRNTLSAFCIHGSFTSFPLSVNIGCRYKNSAEFQQLEEAWKEAILASLKVSCTGHVFQKGHKKKNIKHFNQESLPPDKDSNP